MVVTLNENMTDLTPVHTKENCKIVTALATTIWTEHYTPMIGEKQVAYMLDKFQSAIAIEEQINQGVKYFLIHYRDAYVGYFAFKEFEDYLYLSKVFVQKSAQGNGIGRMVFSFIENCARQIDLNRIRLVVNKFNVQSIQAFEKMGFVNVDEVRKDIGYGFFMDDYVFEKRLS